MHYTPYYDIPYDDKAAYYEAVEKYERDKIELVYGELIDHGPIDVIKNNFKVWFDFSGMTAFLEQLKQQGFKQGYSIIIADPSFHTNGGKKRIVIFIAILETKIMSLKIILQVK